MQNYEGYLFDMDGTLVNSEPLKAKALAMTCSEFNVKIKAEIYKEVMGQSWQAVLEYIFSHAKISKVPESFNPCFEKNYKTLLRAELKLNNGAKKLLNDVKKNEKKCALVTSASQWMVDTVLSLINLEDVFDVIITNEQVINLKPHPEAYQLALKKLAITSKQAIIFEDSRSGVIAAQASGCEVIGFLHNYNQKHNLAELVPCIDSFNSYSLTNR